MAIPLTKTIMFKTGYRTAPESCTCLDSNRESIHDISGVSKKGKADLLP
jgi:hypothetical protein